MRSSYVIAGILAISVGGWIASGQIDGKESVPETPPAAAVDMAAETSLMAVQVRSVIGQVVSRDLVLLGRTEASRSVTVRAETAGRVAKIGAEKGARVEKGKEIARLAQEDRPDRLRQAQALVKQRKMEHEAAQKLSAKAFRSLTKLAESDTMLKSAQAGLAQIRQDIAHTVITVPFAGVLEDRAVEIGDFLDKGDPVATIVDLNPIKVAVDVPEREIGRIAMGALADIEFVDGIAATGTVSFVATVSVLTTRTFRVEVEVANEDQKLRQGTTVKVRLKAGAETAHKMSPAVLTLSDAGIIGVKAVDENDKVIFHAVKLVSDTPDGIWLGGLPSTARVITVGQEFVQVGQTVKAVPESAAGSIK